MVKVIALDVDGAAPFRVAVPIATVKFVKVEAGEVIGVVRVMTIFTLAPLHWLWLPQDMDTRALVVGAGEPTKTPVPVWVTEEPSLCRVKVEALLGIATLPRFIGVGNDTAQVCAQADVATVQGNRAVAPKARCVKRTLIIPEHGPSLRQRKQAG